MNINKAYIEEILAIALQEGAQNARIVYDKEVQNSIKVFNGSLDKIHHSADCSLFIQLFVNGRYGTFSTNRMEKDELRSFISKAAKLTESLAEDKYRMLPDISLYYKGKGNDLKQYDRFIELQTPEDGKKIAFEMAEEILGKNERLISVECEYGDTSYYTYMADSQGFSGESKMSSFMVSSDCSLKDDDGSRPGSWWYESSIFIDKLKIKGCSTRALERGLQMLNPHKLKSGKYNIILENTVSSKFVAPLISSLDGSAIQQNNSFLKDSLGKKIFPECVTLQDDPHIEGFSGSRYFDSEGIATKKRNIISEGIIQTYFLNTYYAGKMGMEPTIEGPSVLRFDKKGLIRGKELSLKDIMKDVGRGVIITEFNGGNYNSVTGDFSYGIQGLYFEHGDIIHPVREMNITGNLIDLWNRVIAIGDDARDCARWRIPALAFERITLSGK